VLPETQATDSPCRGYTAKAAAAIQARQGSATRDASAHTSSTITA
jgi:hypothetical protein